MNLAFEVLLYAVVEEGGHVMWATTTPFSKGVE